MFSKEKTKLTIFYIEGGTGVGMWQGEGKEKENKDKNKITFTRNGKKIVANGIDRRYSYNGNYVLFTPDWVQFHPAFLSKTTKDGEDVFTLSPITLNQRMAVREAIKKAIEREIGEKKLLEKVMPIVIWSLVVVGTFLLAFIVFDKGIISTQQASASMLRGMEMLNNTISNYGGHVIQ